MRIWFQLLASELGVVSTKITKADKAEHIKRKRHRASQTSTSKCMETNSHMKASSAGLSTSRLFLLSSPPLPGVRPPSIGLGFMVQSLGTDDHRMAKMAQQVKDVLPHVPLNVITKDLGRAQVPHFVPTSFKLPSFYRFLSFMQRKPTVWTPP